MSLVCVTGMHRSGTSLVSRVINLLGVDLGDERRLIRPSKNNPRGFWENKPLVKFTEEVLQTLGGSWDDPPPLEDGWEQSAQLDPLRARAREVLEEQLDLERLSGWKDPRASLTLPFWRTVTDIQATILCLRPPQQVAASLARRNGLGPEQSAHLWLRYVAGAWLNDPERLVMRYDEFHEDLPAAIDRICGHIGRPFPDDETLAAIGEFVDPSLQHHPHAEAPPGPSMQLALEIWKLLTTPGTRPEPLLAALNATWTARARAELTERREREALTAELAARTDEIQKLAHELQVERDALEAELAARREQMHKLSEETRHATDAEQRYAQLRNRRAVKLVLRVANFTGPALRKVRRAKPARQTPTQADLDAAESAMSRQNWHAAAHRWRHILDTYGDRAPTGAYARLAATYRRLGDLDAAEATIERGLAKDPDHTGLQTESVEIAMARGDWQDAAARWHHILDTHGRRAPVGAYARLAATYRRLGDLAAAEATIERGLAKRADHTGIRFESAEIAMTRGDWREAAARWHHVLDTYGEDAPERVYTQLSIAYRNAGAVEDADAAFARGLGRAQAEYSDWILRNDTLGTEDRTAIRSRIAALEPRPLFSVLLTVRDTPSEHLRQALDSVERQLYGDWELCVVDDGSISAYARSILDAHAVRVKVTATATNEALEAADGDWVVLLDGSDVLAEHALYLLAEAVTGEPGAVIVYSDHDHLDDAGRRRNPYFKPDWDHDRMLGQNLVGPCGAFRTEPARRAGGFRPGYEGAEDWDLALRVAETAPDAPVVHLPFVLCHRREARPPGDRERAVDGGRRAVAEHLQRTGRQAAVSVSTTGTGSYNRVRWPLPDLRPVVSIVIPTKDRRVLLEACVQGLVERTSYEPLEIVIVDNDSSDPATVEYLAKIAERDDVSVVGCPGAFNFPLLCNRGVAASRGEVVVLLNNDIEVVHADWLDELVGHASRPEVGAVGAKLYYPNDTIQHAGVALGIGRLAGHELRFFPRSADGPFGRARLTRGVSAVTAACLATRRDVYEEVGGLDETNLPVAYNDVDFCLRIRDAGYRVVWTPFAELYHHERASRGADATREAVARSDAEVEHMRKRWAGRLDIDPFYNPNLTLHSESFAFADRSRAPKPWLHPVPSVTG